MRKPQGYAEVILDGKTVRENDTFTCCHCNSIVNVKPFQPPAEMGGFCCRCMLPVCGPCHDYGLCVPFEKALEAHEKGVLKSLAREALFKALG